MNARVLALGLSVLVAASPPADSAAAQTIRVSGSTSLRYIELRPFQRDSVAQELTEGSGLLRQLPDGRVVRCIPGEAFCRDVRPGDVVATVPVLHDLHVSAWGLGEGIAVFTHIRARTTWGGGSELWPRADEALEVLASYVELDRERVRLRAGRQWKTSGLGFYNFDGLAVALRPMPVIWVEAYGGRSLVRGLNEPRTGGALESIEPLSPANAGVLAGVHARYRQTQRFAASVLYQVDFRNDRRSVFSELAAADAALRIGAGSIEGAVEADVASGALNEARLRVGAPPVGRMALYGEARRYRPYFELWTIWGAFSPVGFDEGRVGATWAATAGQLIVRGEAWYRRYGDLGQNESTGAFRNDGWGAGSGISWSPAAAWRLEASYRSESGFGAARRDGHAGVLRQLGGSGSVAVHALAFQRLYEFRLDEGTVFGLGAEAAFQLSARARVVATAAAYRHLENGFTSTIDWSQRRGSVLLAWTLGAEPGLPTRVGGVR